MNGVNLYQGEDFTTSGGNTITLTEATDSDFELVVNNFDKYFTTQLSSIDSAYVTARMPQYGATATVDKYRFVAAANQTLFGGVDADGTTLSYTAGTVQVFLNGILLTPTTDYTATNGTSITLVDPANAGFELLIYDYTKQFNINVIDASFVDSAYIQARQASVNLTSVSQDIIPDLDSSRSLGTPTKKWKDLYLSGGTLHIGGVQIKENPTQPGAISFVDSVGQPAPIEGSTSSSKAIAFNFLFGG
jgi:hypothetical protein